MTAPIDYNAVLADLEAKRSQIEAAIQGIRALVALGITDMPAGATVAQEASTTGDNGAGPAVRTPNASTVPGIASDAFFKLSTAAAIKKYLNMAKRPQTARLIADALHAGGQIHATDPQTAYMNVSSALRRNADFEQTRTKEWGLAEWYGSKGESES